MRLCLITLDIAPDRSSGLAIYAERLALNLAAGGHDVTLIAGQRSALPRSNWLGTVRVVWVPLGKSDWIGYGWSAAHLVSRLAAHQPFDIVHFLDLHFAWAYRGPFVASLQQSFRQRLTADNGQPYAASQQQRLFRQLYYRSARRWLELPTLRRASALVAVSGATRDEFVTHYGLSPERVTVVYEHVDLTHFAPRPTADLRQRLGLDGYRLLLFIGFAAPRKGLEFLAAGLSALPADVRLLLIGRWEAGYRLKVQQAAGVAWERVIELGTISDDALPDYLSLADLVVLPSLLEGFGLPALEALACGTPLVVSAAGSLPEVMGACGSLVPPRNTVALVTAITDLLNDAPRRQYLAQQARLRACTVFDPQQVYAELLRVYRTVAPNA